MTTCSTSQDIWNTLQYLFSQQSLAKVVQLHHQLQNTKKGAMNIGDYILKIKEIGDGLVAAGQVITENYLISSILSGLGRDYDPIVVVVSSQRNTMKVQEAQYLLMLHEQRIEQLSSSGQIDVSSLFANFAAQGFGRGFRSEGGNNFNNNLGGNERG